MRCHSQAAWERWHPEVCCLKPELKEGKQWKWLRRLREEMTFETSLGEWIDFRRLKRREGKGNRVTSDSLFSHLQNGDHP